MQFSQRKAEYIVGLARELADGQLDLGGGSLGARRGRDRPADGGPRAGPLVRRVVPGARARQARRLPADDLGVRRAVEGLLQGTRAGHGRVRTPGPAWRTAPEPRDPLSLAAHARARRVAAGAGGPRRLSEGWQCHARSCRWSAPTRIARAPCPSVGRYALGVTWQDGHGSIYPFTVLRAACPCGACPPAAKPGRREIRREAGGAPRRGRTARTRALHRTPSSARRCPCAQCAMTRRGTDA